MRYPKKLKTTEEAIDYLLSDGDRFNQISIEILHDFLYDGDLTIYCPLVVHGYLEISGSLRIDGYGDFRQSAQIGGDLFSTSIISCKGSLMVKKLWCDHLSIGGQLRCFSIVSPGGVASYTGTIDSLG